MGFEIKMVIGKPYNGIPERNGIAIQKIAELDLSEVCVDDIQRLYNSGTVDCWYYGDDGYGVSNDKYGKHLKMFSLDAVLNELAKRKTYRRYIVGIALLKAIKKQFEGENVVVTLYGH